MPDPCPWCQGARYLTEDFRPAQPGDKRSPVENCPVCNPYGTARPLTDAEMDDLVNGRRER